ncbi:hypothetical protein ACUSIJ_16275 [Pseudochelatococcus sp. B33]
MPVSTRSRYFVLPAENGPSAADGDAPVTYLPMRPEPPATSTQTRLLLTGDDSLESLAHRYYGRSDAWWFIADANPLVFPLDWRPGQSVTLPQGTGLGRVLRTRRF